MGCMVLKLQIEKSTSPKIYGKSFNIVNIQCILSVVPKSDVIWSEITPDSCALNFAIFFASTACLRQGDAIVHHG